MVGNITNKQNNSERALTDPSKRDEQIEARGEKVTDRRFKRYHRVRARQRANAKADDAFFKAVFSLAGVATAFVFILIWAAMNGGGGLAALAPLSTPWLGSFSILEIIGFGVIALLAGVYFWRIRKK